MKAKIYIRLKPAILDAQGKTIESSLHRIGMKELENIRVGKLIELDIQANSVDEAKKQLQIACEKLLYNPVIENVEYELA